MDWHLGEGHSLVKSEFGSHIDSVVILGGFGMGKGRVFLQAWGSGWEKWKIHVRNIEWSPVQNNSYGSSMDGSVSSVSVGRLHFYKLWAFGCPKISLNTRSHNQQRTGQPNEN